MATLRDIRRRINSVKSTQQITKAMKMVAAAKLRRAQQRIVEARPYAFKLREVIASLALRTEPERDPLLARRATGRTPRYRSSSWSSAARLGTSSAGGRSSDRGSGSTSLISWRTRTRRRSEASWLVRTSAGGRGGGRSRVTGAEQAG